jgi:hypothetical protein
LQNKTLKTLREHYFWEVGFSDFGWAAGRWSHPMILKRRGSRFQTKRLKLAQLRRRAATWWWSTILRGVEIVSSLNPVAASILAVSLDQGSKGATHQ